MWDPSCWSYHLGLTSSLNDICNKQSIAIEISNIGYLDQDGNNLNTPYGDFYCTFDQTQYYQILNTGFRNHKFFATYTEEQYKSLILLLRYLTNKFNIPRDFLPMSQRFDTNLETVAKFKGIVTHINYRKDKWDIGPAFDWDRVIKGVIT
jgi:N-acetyl-anhydromuramyl-L-alanine amidase AmpD